MSAVLQIAGLGDGVHVESRVGFHEHRICVGRSEKIVLACHGLGLTGK